jgi:hypothetical protein
MKYLVLALVSLMFSCNKKETTTTISTTKLDTTTVKTSNPKLLIVPGMSIGSISLEQKSEQLEDILGKPDLSDSAMGKAWLTWFTKVGDSITGHEINVYVAHQDGELKQQVVRQIRVTSADFKTKSGICASQTLDEIQKQFPNVKASGKYDMESGQPVAVFDDVDSGIAFEFEDSICTGVIIHHKGHNVYKEYSYFHPDLIPI